MKIFVLVIFTASATVMAAPSNTFRPALDGTIIGGHQVSIKDFPYQLSLMYYNSHICGACLISPKYAVTAGHCTYDSNTSELSIRGGSPIRDFGGVIVEVITVHQHPFFNPQELDYDISVLELASDLHFEVSIQPIGLPTQDQPIAAGVVGIVSGWNRKSAYGSNSVHLQAVDVQTANDYECEVLYFYRTITNRMICTGVSSGKDACQGDSGGPFVINGQLIGIVSWGYGCARPSYPVVYTKISSVRNFIADTSGV